MLAETVPVQHSGLASVTRRPTVLVLTASTRTNRFGTVVAAWFARRARAFDGGALAVTTFDLAATPLQLDGSRADDFGRAVGVADAVVVVTPEYNHSVPGPLKVAVDSLRDEWQAKPIGFVSYGGVSGGLRAVEALRLVFAELHAVPARETVSLARAWDQFDSNGDPLDPTPLEVAAERLLAQVTWWASAVEAGRHSRPYPA